ncbi:hypothetical protein JCM9140_4502 [Halalkalibacter wakoensis JCM 9140]|uniref:DUF1468 domain-containing protein n=1 Tax=Halalkalibacter wakoensis JCM 9140 TaxID=1236970 RepID=W4Q9D7_9BACI|nr:tripartite tricarboxylate transporter TctB family protein [Halalkalibacter wakoensis]GAE28288.1 hypothetical protein JCM9140_4502 [Halalkalibacter wakoensis JCM 9140]
MERYLYSLVLLTIVLAIRQGYKQRRQIVPKVRERKLSYKGFISKPALAWFAVCMLLLCSLYGLYQMPFQQSIFPLLTVLLLFVLAVMEYVKTSLTQGTTLKKDKRFSFSWLLVCLIILVSILSMLTNVIGFYIQVLALMLVIPCFYYYAWKQEEEKLTLKKIIIVAVTFTIILYTVFSLILNVPI